ncbi:hypothetical protein [Candidatus Palauibacter sp.]|uniref:hypothetical protein n=1 Tax=Candidatus Palauibacter sp. TaxID=3101350 RepID=UPI003C700EEC
MNVQAVIDRIWSLFPLIMFAGMVPLWFGNVELSGPYFYTCGTIIVLYRWNTPNPNHNWKLSNESYLEAFLRLGLGTLFIAVTGYKIITTVFWLMDHGMAVSQVLSSNKWWWVEGGIECFLGVLLVLPERGPRVVRNLARAILNIRQLPDTILIFVSEGKLDTVLAPNETSDEEQVSSDDKHNGEQAPSTS